jgi:urea carboxylase
MEGPGGYQLVGRTVPVWNRFHRTREFEQPWLLRFFDQLRFFPVSAEELLDWRRDLPLGRISLDIEPTTLRMADHLAFLSDNKSSITTFRDRQQASFNEERTRWSASGELERAERAAGGAPVDATPTVTIPPGSMAVEAALQSSVWQVPVEVGQRVSEGDVLVVLEAMKMETRVLSPTNGEVVAVYVRRGQEVAPGQPLAAVMPS